MNDSIDLTSQNPTCPLGRQILVDLYDCDTDCLNHVEVIKTILIEVADSINTNVIDSSFHEFSPCGVSGVLIISESHIAIHTWPELGFAAVDVFTCGDRLNPDLIQSEFGRRFGAKRSEKQIIYRGNERMKQS